MRVARLHYSRWYTCASVFATVVGEEDGNADPHHKLLQITKFIASEVELGKAVRSQVQTWQYAKNATTFDFWTSFLYHWANWVSK